LIDLLWTLPFVLILLSIAVFPLAAHTWWSKNYPWVALPLGLIIVFRYVVFTGEAERILATGHEYLSFIILIGSLYVVAGGIHISILGVFTPKQNVILLAVGAILANFIGTTGASMILIRPFLRANRWRLAPFHAVFFIFIVSNCGGALTPIGDPPLFLGYLIGVPFFWVLQSLWYKWMIGVGLLLLIFFVVDLRHFRQRSVAQQETAERKDWMLIEGKRNFFFLSVILLAVVGSAFLPERLMWLRDAVILIAGVASYLVTPKVIHERNNFDFHPIREVAILFAAIFAAMVPALDWLSLHASSLGLNTAGSFYWATGLTSAFLDNAPAYLNFVAAAMGLDGASVHDRAQVLLWANTHPDLLRSISISSVFFGAATYIGNGPNFMVKSICEQFNAKTPGFLEYIVKYSLPILLPVLVVIYFLVK
jgi:Na+/H+ antiporter NhaD/arsenite permease-like protein